MPLYPLYALLFADAGMSAAQVSALFALWSAVAVVAEVPAGALADRFSRRGALVAAGLLQAAGHALWVAAPGFPGFAAGFALWGVAGALSGAAFQALLHDGLAAHGARARFPRALARAEAAGFLVQVPIAAVAGGLHAVGGFTAAGVASVAACCAAAAVAAGLPDLRPASPSSGAGGDDGGEGAGYLATLRAGAREAARVTAVRRAVAAVALLAAVDAVEEYTPLMAAGWGVPASAVPLALLAVPLAGAAGSALGARLARRGAMAIGAAALAAAAALAGAVAVAAPAGVAGLALFYLGWRAAAVAADVRLQQRITGTARATVTAFGGAASEAATVGLFAAWAAGGATLVAGLAVAAALAAPALLGGRRGAGAARGRAR